MRAVAPDCFIEFDEIFDTPALDERGNQIPGSGFSPNRHDILTGSTPEGRAYPAGADMTCGNWTKGSKEGAAMTGHFDRGARLHEIVLHIDDDYGGFR